MTPVVPSGPARRRLLPALGALVQLGALARLAGGGVSVPEFLAGHAAGAALATAGLIPFAKRDLRPTLPFLVILGTLCLLFPAMGVALACGLERLLARAKPAGALADHVVWDESMTHFVPSHSVDADIDMMRAPAGPTFSPGRPGGPGGRHSAVQLPDRLRDMDPEIRRDAILPLAGLRTDHAALILRAAMEDADEQVRLLAQNSLQSIRDRHDEILISLNEAIAKNPGNPINHLRLADSYSALADMNLDRDRESTDENRRKAAREIEFAASLPTAGDNPEIALRLLRRTLIMGRPDLAPHFAAKARAAAPDDVRLLEATIEIAYGNKDWATMLANLRALPPAPLSSPLFRSVKNYWLPGGGDAA